MFQKNTESYRWSEIRKASLNISSSVDRPQKLRSASVSVSSTRNWSPVISHNRKDDIIFELPPCLGPDGKLVGTLQNQPEFPIGGRFSDSNDHPLTNKHSPFENDYPAKDDQTPETDVSPVKTATIKTLVRPDSTNSCKDNVLGAIQPEFYKSSPNKVQHGSICFSMIYDGAVETLTVKVIKVKQLQPRPSTKEPTSRNSFVRLFLLPDEQNYHQTKTRYKCNNPIFNQEFPFQVINSIKSDKTLRFSVYDEIKSSHILLGHALVNLDDVTFSKPNDEMWRNLDKPARVSGSLIRRPNGSLLSPNQVNLPGEIGNTPNGSIHIALSYNPASGRFGVFVFNVKDLNMLNLEETAGICVKLIFSQDDVFKAKKTSMKLNSSCVTFNESFSFHVDKSRVDYMSLTVKVVAYGSNKVGLRRLSSSFKSTLLGKKKGSHECGHVTFCAGSHHDREEGFHWKEIMAKPGKSVPKWHALHDPVQSSSVSHN